MKIQIGHGGSCDCSGGCGYSGGGGLFVIIKPPVIGIWDQGFGIRDFGIRDFGICDLVLFCLGVAKNLALPFFELLQLYVQNS